MKRPNPRCQPRIGRFAFDAFRSRRSTTAKPALLIALALMPSVANSPAAQSERPEVIAVRSGALTLHAEIWRPDGGGPFPAVLFNHGSYSADDQIHPEDSAALGPTFARHGYVFMFLFRQGIGQSVGQGTADGDLMARALAADGVYGRNRVQLELLEREEMNEAAAGMAALRKHRDVDPRRIALAGHSFGGSLTLLQAARDADVRAVVVFGAAAGSWAQSPDLRNRLLAAVDRIPSPVLFIHPANDYSTEPGKALAAEMQRARKPHDLKIYPAVGRTPREGHNFLFTSLTTWEADVFAFLDAHVRR